MNGLVVRGTFVLFLGARERFVSEGEMAGDAGIAAAALVLGGGAGFGGALGEKGGISLFHDGTIA